MAVSLGRRQAFSDEQFGDTAQTWRKQTEAAIAKEHQKYLDFEVYDTECEEWSDLCARDPMAQKVILAVILTRQVLGAALVKSSSSRAHLCLLKIY